MKKIVLISFVFLFSLTNSKASHVAGGEITWQCLDDGRYLFYLNFYRDCSGINQTYIQEDITISGFPLPSAGLNRIIMYPDSVPWSMNSNGQIPSNCNLPPFSQFSCRNLAQGLLEFYSYRSDTITLTGVPPPTGWKFDYMSTCCYPGKMNTNSISYLNFRSIMYPNINGDSVNTCFDSSPTFAELPSYIFCRGQLSTVNHFATDVDGDSLTYEQVSTYGSSSSRNSNSRTPIVYSSGYSQVSPTPDQSFNSNNLPYTLNNQTGDISFKVVNGTGAAQYTTNTLITAWRNGVRIASISRAIPITILDCDTIANGKANNPPYLEPPFPNNLTNPFHGVVTAGSSINVSVVVRDSNSNFFATNPQSFNIVPLSGSLSRDLINPRNCLNPNDTSCAVFSFAPSIDSSVFPSVNYYLSYSSGLLNLNWNTDCNHLNRDGSARTHYFLIKATDNHCPVPAMAYKTISITVIPPVGGCNLATKVIDRINGKNGQIQVFPNPSDGLFYLSGLSQEEIYFMEIRNIQGQLVQQQQFTNQSNLELEIKGKAGVYFVQLTNEKGERANLKVVKR